MADNLNVAQLASVMRRASRLLSGLHTLGNLVLDEDGSPMARCSSTELAELIADLEEVLLPLYNHCIMAVRIAQDLETVRRAQETYIKDLEAQLEDKWFSAARLEELERGNSH